MQIFTYSADMQLLRIPSLSAPFLRHTRSKFSACHLRRVGTLINFREVCVLRSHGHISNGSSIQNLKLEDPLHLFLIGTERFGKLLYKLCDKELQASSLSQRIMPL